MSEWTTAAFTSATIVLVLLVARGVSQNQQQQTTLQGLVRANEEARKTNEASKTENARLSQEKDALQQRVRDTLKTGADSAALIAEFIADIDSMSSRKKLEALDHLLSDLPKSDTSILDFQRRFAVAVQFGRCKLLHALERLREAELAGVAALEWAANASEADVTPQDRATTLRLLHELVDIRSDRGDVHGMKATVNQALRMIDEIDESTASDSVWVTLKSQTYAKLGQYFEVVGNPWRQRDAYHTAREFAIEANSIAESTETQIHLAQLERLEIASISAIASKQLELNAEHNREAQRLANAALERIKRHSDGSIFLDLRLTPTRPCCA